MNRLLGYLLVCLLALVPGVAAADEEPAPPPVPEEPAEPGAEVETPGPPSKDVGSADAPPVDEPLPPPVLSPVAVQVERAHEGLVRALAAHPTAAIMATGGSDRALRIWELGGTEPKAELILPRSG